MSEKNNNINLDIKETDLLRENKKILEMLILDRTTGKNIRWATDTYSKCGESFREEKEIKVNLITGWYDGFIRPRVDKDSDIQIERTKNKAEVFTPSWIIKKQIDVVLDELKTLSFEKFIQTRWLELTCGEAPYMVNRYDMISGEIISLDKRSGFIDEKFRRLNKKKNNKKEWIKLAILIYQSSYGYEYQGDSLILARENLLLTFIDNYFYKFGEFPEKNLILRLADIISKNVFQMDGLTYMVPYSEVNNKVKQLSMFEEKVVEETEPLKAKITLWELNKIVDFINIVEGSEKKMKFDVVIGNPPYQIESESDSTRKPPIYHLFMEQSYKISSHSILITPARFLFNAGFTPRSWNIKMLNDNHFKVVMYEEDSSKIFSNTQIKGGVAISYRNIFKNYGAIKTFTKYPILNSILNKIKNYCFEYMDLIISPPLSYSITEKMKEDNPDLVDRLRSSAFEKLERVFFDEIPNDANNYVALYGLDKGKRVKKFIKKDYVTDGNGTLEKYTVLLSKAIGSGVFGEKLSSTIVAKPGEGYLQTFIGIGKFDTIIEANNVVIYLKTKFLRAMLGILKITQDCPGPKWKFVPIQDFTSNSDIDWSKSIHEIDQQLYKKYNLSGEEIDFIEKNVQEME